MINSVPGIIRGARKCAIVLDRRTGGGRGVGRRYYYGSHHHDEHHHLHFHPILGHILIRIINQLTLNSIQMEKHTLNYTITHTHLYSNTYRLIYAQTQVGTSFHQKCINICVPQLFGKIEFY